jgi:hypothetical protein
MTRLDPGSGLASIRVTSPPSPQVHDTLVQKPRAIVTITFLRN